MSEAPALSRAVEGLWRPETRSNHHRYGEVKTRLTIGACDDFARSISVSGRAGSMPSKVQKNGRVTVPKRVRDYLGLRPGTEVVLRARNRWCHRNREGRWHTTAQSNRQARWDCGSPAPLRTNLWRSFGAKIERA